MVGGCARGCRGGEGKRVESISRLLRNSSLRQCYLEMKTNKEPYFSILSSLILWCVYSVKVLKCITLPTYVTSSCSFLKQFFNSVYENGKPHYYCRDIWRRWFINWYRICACLSLRTGFSQELMKVKEPQNYKDILPTLYSVML